MGSFVKTEWKFSKVVEEWLWNIAELPLESVLTGVAISLLAEFIFFSYICVLGRSSLEEWWFGDDKA